MEITLDEGYSFGLGAFETIAVKDGKLIFLDRHLRRLDRARYISLKKDRLYPAIHNRCRDRRK